MTWRSSRSLAGGSWMKLNAMRQRRRHSRRGMTRVRRTRARRRKTGTMARSKQSSSGGHSHVV
jgi:hypothetical protein